MSEDPPEESRASRVRLYLKALIAPLCLAMIAMGQIRNARSSSLSPWKGGGFGMFSSVDSQAARFLHIYLITGKGEIPVAAPAALAAKSEPLKVSPNRERIDQFAQRLTELRFVDLDRKWHKIDRQVKSQDGQHATTRDALYSESSEPARSSWQSHGRLTGVRAAGVSAADEVVLFQAIRVEVWRLVYDQTTNQLLTQKIIESTKSKR